MNDTIKLTKNGSIAIITINRPKNRNALNSESINEFANVVALVETDKTTQVIVLTGGGGTFCAGADLNEISDLGSSYQPWAGADGPLSKHCSKPVIAAIEGHAVAGGLGLALWADIRVASETAVFGVYCRRFGIPMSDGTPTRLPLIVGRSRALDMLLTGRPIDAKEAFRIGLADRKVAGGSALKEAIALAKQISIFPTLAMQADRATAWAAFDSDETTLLKEESSRAQTAKLADAADGAARFKNGLGRGGEFISENFPK